MAEDRESYFVAAGEPWSIGMVGGPSLEITARLRQAIIDGPEVLGRIDQEEGSIAYVFGRPAPSQKAISRGKWIKVGSHVSEGAGTCLIDATDGDHSGRGFEWNEQLNKALFRADGEFSAACRALDARVLWVGPTPGADLGAELYIPAKDKGKPATALIVNALYYNGAEQMDDDTDDSESIDDDRDGEVARLGARVAVATDLRASSPPLSAAGNDNGSQLSSDMC